MTDDKNQTAPLTTVVNLREPLFVADTPYTGASKVVCYTDTFTTHIREDRHEVGLQDRAILTLSSPSAVLRGTTTPGYVAFVNLNLRSTGSNNPFVVFVDPNAAHLATVATMGFRRDFNDLSKHTTLWKPQADDVE